MTTWILIVSYCTGCTVGYEYAITGLPDYAECVRVSQEIPKVDGSNIPRQFKCIEVKK